MTRYQKGLHWTPPPDRLCRLGQVSEPLDENQALGRWHLVGAHWTKSSQCCCFSIIVTGPKVTPHYLLGRVGATATGSSPQPVQQTNIPPRTARQMDLPPTQNTHAHQGHVAQLVSTTGLPSSPAASRHSTCFARSGGPRYLCLENAFGAVPRSTYRARI